MDVAREILVVDDDPRLCRLLARYLSREGYNVRTATSGEDLERLIGERRPDLVILDVMLPGEDGFSLARALRSQSEIPIIMLTARADLVDKVVGLELGADDYITKPFQERELLARVRCVLRRAARDAEAEPHNGDSVARFGEWILNLSAHELRSPVGQRIHLTAHEFGLLSALVRRHNRVLNRDEILDLIAGRDWSPCDRTIDVLVARLRKKIEDDPHSPGFIETVRGVGYKFLGPVQFE